MKEEERGEVWGQNDGNHVPVVDSVGLQCVEILWMLAFGALLSPTPVCTDVKVYTGFWVFIDVCVCTDVWVCRCTDVWARTGVWVCMYVLLVPSPIHRHDRARWILADIGKNSGTAKAANRTDEE